MSAPQIIKKIEPKEYQRKALIALQVFFKTYQQLDDVELAYFKTTRDTFGKGLSFTAVDELPGLPYVCLRIPTGGGKTLVACYSINVAAKELLHADSPVVLWLVPSNTIREQTLKALKDKSHPYCQAVEETFPTTNVLSIQEALYVTRPTLATGATIIVSTIQAFRVDDTEGRKVYEQSGALMEHFNGIDPALLESLEKYEDGRPIQSLANLLRLHRPIIIVDEAHNARTTLSFETLARFNPSCIIEFTATPDTEKSPSNVLHSVSAAELKADRMIKLPIRLETRPNWKELLDDAITMRSHLEDEAGSERKATGEYIRPIMLIQAQSQLQGQERLTVEVVEQCLLEDCQIPSEQICRATGTDKGLEGIDLSLPTCEIRYIITVQALREGWDCPFAYVLCSVAEMRSSTAVEQILGRIMRLPNAEKKNNDDLNMAYAFSASKDFVDAANALEDALVQNGFNRQEAKDFILKAPTGKQGEMEHFWTHVVEPVPEPPKLDALPAEVASKVSYDEQKGEITFKGVMAEPDKHALQECFTTPEGKAAVERVYRKTRGLPAAAKSPAERGEPFSVPALAIKQGELFVQFEDTYFLDRPWRLSQCDFKLTDAEYSQKPFDGKVVEIDITDKGKIGKRFIQDLQEQMNLLTNDHSQTVVNLVYWLDRNIPHQDVIPSESGAFLAALINHLIEERKFTIGQLYHDKFNLRQKVTAKIEAHRKAAHFKAYQSLLLPECETPLLVTPEFCFSFDPNEYPYNTKYHGSYHFQKHYYKNIGSMNGEEEACAIFLDTHQEMKFWVRNIEKNERYSFWLQTSTDRFYPDFVCLLKDGRFLAVEYKGADRWSDDDSREKRALGELWEKRSGGTCIFVMPKGKDLAAITAKL
ncbi:MAG: type III restriction protein res [Geobacteraceae bacterium]|nr:MAG: type III restriction protein res [Geobacteraceae bacterium]